jgi:hypothetical protein
VADEIIIVSSALSFVVYGDRRVETAVIASFEKATDFVRDSKLNVERPMFMDCSMAYEHLVRFGDIGVSRDEFFRSWKC